MQNIKKKAAVFTAAVMTAVVTVLRIVLTPHMQDTHTGTFRLSYWVIGIMTLTVVILLVLTRLYNRRPQIVRGGLLMPASLSAMLFGAILLVSSIFDFWLWIVPPHVTPPPNERLIGTLDGVALFLTLLFGIIGGLFFIRVGLQWIADSTSRSGVYRLWALAPVAWIWMRLARYEMSYASAVDVSESFYDFVMLIFTLLFLFSFSRFVSGIGEKPPRMLLFFSLCTGLFSISGTVTRFVMYLIGSNDAYRASELAGFADFAVGVFAFCLACSQVIAVSRTRPDLSVDQLLEDIHKSEE